MSSHEGVLFIGGEIDGQRRSVQKGVEWVQHVLPPKTYPVSLDEPIQHQSYQRRRFVENTIAFDVFVLAGKPFIIEHLCKHYRPEAITLPVLTEEHRDYLLVTLEANRRILLATKEENRTNGILRELDLTKELMECIKNG